MDTSISIYAGSEARKQLQENGFHSDQFKVMAGASGGPKWFTLFGLDKYLFGEFFANRKQTLHTIGSSAGSWRLACFAQNDPVAAISRLARYYSQETYSEKPDVHEISDKAEILLNKVLGETGASDIANNPVIHSHFIVARAKGFNASEHRLKQSVGLLKAALANSLNRNNIANYFERFVFHSQTQAFPDSYFQLTDLPTRYVPLKTDNVHATLMGSGSIPLVLRGVSPIPGAPDGIYRDGGIIDYHLDLDFGDQGLVLYPHFFPKLKPGWFDKALKKRNVSAHNYRNVVVITPSPEHVARLPFAKISDRKDFETLDTQARIAYWQTVLDESHRLADDFKLLVEKNQGMEKIRPVEDII